MKRSSMVAVALLTAGVAALWHAQDAVGEASFVTLFDGKTLDHWNKIGDANWRIEDGAVVADKGNGFLVSKESYTDFEIKAEFWVDTPANSGIFIRCTNPEKIGTDSGYEVNIFDTRPDPKYGTGAIVGVAAVEPMPKAANKWNTYEIMAKGPQFFVTLNGTKTVNGVSDSKFPSGRIGLQYGAGVVKFRKVEVKRL